MEEYKKSYKGLVIWLILYMAAFFVPVFLPAEVKLITLLCYNIMIIGCAVLTYMIYKNEKIYWYSGIFYEDAAKMTSPQRKAYAFKMFKRFAVFAVLYVIYSVIAYVTGVHSGVNLAVASIGLVGVALSTLNIKLE